MAGVSLKCGDCGALLKSVEEAQEHAELTFHSNFSESTEAVLNLVCSACGKPCRSKTESDLHTKRTGHTEFVDKTLETAKPISLEVPKVAMDSEETVDAGSTSQSEEMVVPEVDKKLLEELEAMGFPTARATRALHFSGNTSLEAAVNWVVEHEADTDIDEMPMVSVNKNGEAPKPSLTPEEMKLKAQELRERARKKKEEEEKRMEREREKERIRVGKELLEAKRIEEENERKRLMALRKAEKEEEKRALEKIRQKLEEDKAERRRRLGLPPEEPSAAPKPSASVFFYRNTIGSSTISPLKLSATSAFLFFLTISNTETKSALGSCAASTILLYNYSTQLIPHYRQHPAFVEYQTPFLNGNYCCNPRLQYNSVSVLQSALPVRPATKAEQMRECLRSLKQNHKDDDAKVKKAFQTLLTYIGNVARNPDEEKFRRIRLNNQTFQDRVGSLKGGVEFLELCGFEKVEGDEFLFLSRNKVGMQVLNSAGSELNSAINNPFFGIL
ncbi:eukaryotic translation initiation factor 3 subunit A-like [Hibiscus syriacus]|uniref:eukaryotic translation initiation factor 3 subunit A-like n=1 Tax=Hibiscus syriacus TaxID=106335 RepID=UPI001921BD28|nr:eukaryotic translation initiation factor 3 subunit A-like [Hibiscus syriacus]